LEQLRGFLGQPKETRPRRGAGIFRAADLTAVALLRDSPHGLKTDDLAQALGISNASLPPTLNGWSRRAAARGLCLDDLLERNRVNAADGRPITSYKLTEAGKAVVAEQLEDSVPGAEVQR
jgi:predicted ArsR family transcriptional regulator